MSHHTRTSLAARFLRRGVLLLGSALVAAPGLAHDDNHAHNHPAPSYASPAASAERPSGSGRPRSGPTPIPGAMQDEPLRGYTQHGTPVTKRTPECFPAETRDLFWQMDAVAGPDGQLEPLNFDVDGDGKISATERHAIQGRNTWVLWAAGNETFWNWLQQDGYGLVDFLVLLDSRQRKSRFDDLGVMNQPGMAPTGDPGQKLLGLYIDQPATTASELPAWLAAYRPKSVGPANPLPEYGAAPGPIWMTQPDTDRDENGQLAQRVEPPPHHPKDLFPTGGAVVPKWTVDGKVETGPDGKPLTQPLADFVRDVERRLPKDGVDYTVYGYPSGVVGLRLFLNPDFFANTKAADEARHYWNERVVKTNDRFYSDPDIQRDPFLVRPFRVAMSCGFCHVGPHPLSPAADPNAPEWHNLSSIIGAQYWKPQPNFGNLLKRDNFIYHFLHSQQPGTIDTSLVSTDHINNANTINAVFDVPARLARAKANPPEQQSRDNLLVPSIEDGVASINPRHTPRVLLDGADSIGAWGALARVYLNIGTFSEEWATRHNPIIGFKHQKPFGLEVSQHNSVFWQTNERYRVPYLAAFFTMKRDATAKPATPPVPTPASYGAQNSTGPMKLRDAKDPDGATPSKAAAAIRERFTADQRVAGRKIWLNNCAVCHSSKQPDGFALDFKADWASKPVPAPGEPAHYTLPLDARDWDRFKQSPAYRNYVERLHALVGSTGGNLDQDPWDQDHPFFVDNFLSSEIRIPLSLVGTNSGRAMATNGLKGEVWDNFSSETYKALPPSGQIRFFNPFSDTSLNGFDNTNDAYDPPGEGRGYYRPASHIALWATAPFLHNNTLGLYNHDISVEGRLVAYEDAIRRMFWLNKRASTEPLAPNAGLPPGSVVAHPGDLRHTGSAAAAKDPGFIYRIPLDTHVDFAPGFIRPLIQGVVGPFVTSLLTVWIWVILFAILVLAALMARPRHAGILVLALALVALLSAFVSAFGGNTTLGIVLGGLGSLSGLNTWLWVLLAALLGVAGFALLFAREDSPTLARIVVLSAAILVGFLVGRLAGSLWIALAIIAVGALAAWRIRWNITRWVRFGFALGAVVVVLVGWSANRFINGKTILHVPIANITVGPLELDVGPIPRGTPVSLVMNMDPFSPHLPKAAASMVVAVLEIRKNGLSGEEAYKVFAARAGQNLLNASRCPDLVLDRGHGFAESLTDEEKESLIAFLLTL